jgi:hypothetical protein
VSPLYRKERVGPLFTGPAPGNTAGSSHALVSIELPRVEATAVGEDCAIADLDRQQLEDLREVLEEALR